MNAPSMLCCCCCCCFFVLPGISSGSALQFPFHAFCFLADANRQSGAAAPGPYPCQTPTFRLHTPHVPRCCIQDCYKTAISPPSTPKTDEFCYFFFWFALQKRIYTPRNTRVSRHGWGCHTHAPTPQDPEHTPEIILILHIGSRYTSVLEMTHAASFIDSPLSRNLYIPRHV